MKPRLPPPIAGKSEVPAVVAEVEEVKEAYDLICSY